MHISVTDAKAKLFELARRAMEGEEVIITRNGRRVAQLVPMEARDGEHKHSALKAQD